MPQSQHIGHMISVASGQYRHFAIRRESGSNKLKHASHGRQAAATCYSRRPAADRIPPPRDKNAHGRKRHWPRRRPATELAMMINVLWAASAAVFRSGSRRGRRHGADRALPGRRYKNFTFLRIPTTQNTAFGIYSVVTLEMSPVTVLPVHDFSIGA